MAGAVNTRKNGNATSSNKNGKATSSNNNGNATSSNKNGTTSSAETYHQKHTSIQVVDKKRETHHTFKVRYYNDKIRTTVTQTESVVDQWIAQEIYKKYSHKLDNYLVVGLDIKWVGKKNKVDVLQLCVGHRCLIIQLFGCDKKQVPASLVNFLNDKRILFVRAGIDEAAHKLSTGYGLSIATGEDLGEMADYKLKTRGLHQLDLNSLMNIVLDKHLHHQLPKKFKRNTLGRWDRNYLDNNQVEYACLDAYASFELGLYLWRLKDPRDNQQVSPRN